MDPMSIANLSVAMSQNTNMQQLGLSVLSMAMDDSKALAANTTAMINELPAPAKEPGKGGGIDVSV